MAKYIVLIRTKPAQIQGKGADKGDVIAIREPGSRITKTEKKNLLILEVEMTKIQAAEMYKKVRPQSSFMPVSMPPDDPEKREIWEAAMEKERQKLPQFGLKVDFTNVIFLDNPLTASKTIIKDKK